MREPDRRPNRRVNHEPNNWGCYMSKRKKDTKTSASTCAGEKPVDLPPAEDAGHPAVTEGPGIEPPQAQPEPTEPAGQAAAPTADSGPRATSGELAVLYCLTRDQMDAELVRLGLRGPRDDGATLYSVTEVARRFSEEDDARIAAAAELTDAFANDALVTEAVQEAIAEMQAKWLIDCDLHGELAALKQGILAKLRKMHAYQRTRRAGDIWGELGVLQWFEQTLLAKTAARRQQKGEARQP